MNKLTDDDYEKFNSFIFAIDDSIDELKNIGEQNGILFNFSKSTPDDLERIIIKLDILRDNHHLVNVLGQYLGEYFIKVIGGQWELGNDPESSITFNQPVIGGHNSIGHVFNPVRTIRTFAGRRKPGIIASSMEAERGIDRLSHLTPEE